MKKIQVAELVMLAIEWWTAGEEFGFLVGCGSGGCEVDG
jgi:hypothetical protein